MVRLLGNRRWGTWIAALITAMFIALAPAEPALAHALEAHINLTHQRMDVSVNGRHHASWVISSGRQGYLTPTGSYSPTWLNRMHYSSQYDNAPMPYSIFFHRGYAIHGTDQAHRLGQPASHGCVRLHPRHAAELFALVRQHGKTNTRIHVSY
jgi:lipoprotein-anchoring transpeptidase ErfK/SrfK